VDAGGDDGVGDGVLGDGDGDEVDGVGDGVDVLVRSA
jgi:hypothetical protein